MQHTENRKTKGDTPPECNTQSITQRGHSPMQKMVIRHKQIIIPAPKSNLEMTENDNNNNDNHEERVNGSLEVRIILGEVSSLEYRVIYL